MNTRRLADWAETEPAALMRTAPLLPDCDAAADNGRTEPCAPVQRLAALDQQPLSGALIGATLVAAVAIMAALAHVVAWVR